MFHNLTEGNPYKIIIRLTVPILISYLVQQMYNMVDTMVVGRMVGSSALAAVGATGNIYFFISSFIMGLTQGFATVTANKFGAGEDKGVKRTIYHSLLLISGISVFLSVIALFFLEGFLNLMNTPEEIFRDAYGYISIIIAGMVITAVLNLFYALFRSLGDTRTPLLFLLFSKTREGGAATQAAGGEANPVSLVMLAVPLVIIVLCMMRKHLITALSWGILAGIAVGLLFGIYRTEDLIAFPGGFSVSGAVIDAISGTSGTVAMLVAVFSLLGVLECGGLFEDVKGLLERFAKKERSSEVTIVLSVGILSMVTGVISVAIVALGDLVNEIGERAGVNRYRRANLLDCTGCVFCFLAPWTVHCVIPAQLSAQFGEGFAVAPASVPFVNFYSLCMLAVLAAALLTGYGSKPPGRDEK
jgi:hypothetical protein